MKKLLSLSAAAWLTLLLVSCGADEKVVVRASVRLSPPDPLTFTCEGGTARLEVKTNQDRWEVSSDQPWCKADAQGNILLVTCAENLTRNSMPQATVRVTAGSGENISSATLTVNQTGVPPTDLTATGTANCFIVPAGGAYRFHVGVRGKSDESTVENPALCNAAVVWTTDEGLIELNPRVSEDGYISFTAPDSFRPGNAVVGLVRENKTVWSWHLWFTDKVARSATTPFMNINLGATDDGAGSGAALGLMYQWGRKDPFPGASDAGDYMAVFEGGFNETSPFAEGSENGTAYTASTTVNGELAEAWKVDPTSEQKSHEECAAAGTTFYGKASALPDNSSRTWSAAADPCPAGWHVPSYTEMSQYFENYKFDYREYQGVVLNDECHWPATGYRNTYSEHSNGRLRYVGRIAMYWMNMQRQYAQFGCGIYFDPTQILVNDFMISYGLPVRCIADDVRQ